MVARMVLKPQLPRPAQHFLEWETVESQLGRRSLLTQPRCTPTQLHVS